MERIILQWLDDGKQPELFASPLPLNTPQWLSPNSLPQCKLGVRALPWKHTLMILLACRQRPDLEAQIVGPLLDAQQSHRFCDAVATRWLTSRSEACSTARMALRALSPPARAACITRAVTTRLCHAREVGVRRLLSVLDVVDGPEVWMAIGAIALWPRAMEFRHLLHQQLAAMDPDGDWRALLLERVSQDVDLNFRFADSTARGVPGSLQYFRANLFEHAMAQGARWPQPLWEARVRAFADPLNLILDQDPQEKTVSIAHPAAVACPSLPEGQDEAFDQRCRAVFTATSEEVDQRMVRRYRELAIVDVHLRKFLRKRGWLLGKIYDYPQVQELFVTLYEPDWCAYVRIFPGIPPDSVNDEPVQLFGIAFLRGATSRPRWGGYFRRTHAHDDKHGHRTFIMTMTEPTECEPYRTMDQVVGVPLGEVPPHVFSEVLRLLDARMRRHGQPLRSLSMTLRQTVLKR